MNKKLIYLLMFVFTLGLSFTACGSDDDDDYAKEIAATYNGKIIIPGMTSADGDANSIVLARASENKVNLALNEIVLQGLGSVKNIAVKNVPVTKSGDTYALTSTTETIKIKLGEVEVGATVTVSGTVKAGKLDLIIYVKDITVLPIPDLVITFSGTK
ncbi:MAG: calycin-like domain-containing protein [Prevotella sp.]|jgi:hypothetical protein|nr:calycin-like domain-containing protein [Prevotella sp.]